MLVAYLLGIAVGLSLTAPPGPVNSVIMSESMRSKVHGMSVGAGAMTADFIFFVIVYKFGRLIPETYLHALYIIGALLLFYLSYSVLKSKSSQRTRGGNYAVGFSMGITNPFQILWWITVGLFFIRSFHILAIAGLFSGIVIWIVTFPLLMNRYAKRFEKYVKLFSFIVLFSFAVYLMFSGISSIAR
ncbi:lysine transporter LysE [Thermoplasma sp. Kam2015]|uniref:LysE family translocator n=1 Tax=Thermoplasma sp. Kam2015 TaxID=2094122 RepID=UPI000D91467F|nr:lysine transporter LysE [Thermoplasma sp. Kam2015]